VGKLSKRAMQLITLLLQLDPNTRPTTETMLNHVYFEECNQSKNRNRIMNADSKDNNETNKPISRQNSTIGQDGKYSLHTSITI
jgi:serine/threonine protein kinase